VAQVAIQQGINLAENFKRMSANKSLKPLSIMIKDRWLLLEK
jgi:NADH dehydrogenase FAD-containing subunit